MKNALFLIISVLFFTSCRKQMAYFQPSHYETFERKNKPKTTDNKELTEISQIQRPAFEDELVSTSSEFSNTVRFEEDKAIFTFEKPTRKIEESKENPIDKKEIKSFVKTNLKELKKHKRRGDNFWDNFNERIKIGLLLLAVAVIFELIGLTVLAIIFGILAAYMIIRGLKRVL